MTFLNQALLFGLFAVSIPIIIHFLNRRRFREVPWAAMRFLVVSVEQNQRRMKLEDLILLLLRCALLALLAFAVARPVVAHLQGLPGSKVAAALVIDNSASMGTVEGEGTRTRLDRAREAAEAVLDQMPVASSVAVATPFRPDEPTTEHALARRRIAEVSQTDRHADLLTALRNAARVLEGQAAAEKEIYLVTDGHAQEWSAFAALEEALRAISADTTVHVILVGSPAASNLGISRLVPSGALPAVDRPFRIDVDVTNYGRAPVRDVPVRLLVDGQPAAAEEPWVIDEIRPGRSESATLYASLPGPGYHRITAALGPDSLSFDNERTLVVRAVDRVRVLLVDGEPGAEPRESETFFLRHALAPVPEEAREFYPVQPTVVSGSEFASANLADFEAIVLANVADLPLAMADRLAEFVEAGGGLIVFPGENVRPEFYNTLLHTRHELLPAIFLAHDGEAGASNRLSLEPTETNPLGLDGEILASASFRKSFRLGPPPSTGSGQVALRYHDGSPALVEGEFGLGKVFLFTSTADMAWNDFAVKPGFVPFVNRLLGGIVQHREANLNVAAGEVLVHRLDPALAGREATVSEVSDPESLGRLTTIENRDGAALLTFRETHRAGAYQATIADHPTPVLFAAQPSARESTLELIGTEQIDRLRDSATVIRWSGAGRAAELRAERKGSELWLPVLLLVLLIAALELGLAQWFSRAK